VYQRSARVVVLALLSLVALAGADSGAPTKENARIHFKAGSAFLEIGEYEKAIAEYLEAYRLLPAPDFLFNIGQAYRLKGTPGDRQQAARYYRQYIKQKPDGVGVAEAKQHLAIIEKEPGLIIQETPPPALWTEPTVAPPPPKPTPATATIVAPPPTVVDPPKALVTATAPGPTPLVRRPAFVGGVVAGAVLVAGVVAGVTVGAVVGAMPLDPMPTGGFVNYPLWRY
jgi:hypothetical protein